jgi:hypothetical protein
MSALQAAYPEYQWHSKRKENKKPAGYWNNKQNQREFFDKLAVALNITDPTDWHKVGMDIIHSEGGSFVNTHYKGSLIRGK